MSVLGVALHIATFAVSDFRSNPQKKPFKVNEHTYRLDESLMEKEEKIVMEKQA